MVVTDTWVSMGKEDEVDGRLAVFGPYSVTTELFAPRRRTTRSCCTACPAYRGKEVDAEVLDGPRSVIWDEAENRRHAQKAILTWLLEAGGGHD